MFRIVEARTRAEMRRFFDFSPECGYSRDEAEYIRRYAAPALNPIRTSERAYLYAEKDGRITGRLLTWKDRMYDKAAGENCGFFSLCDALSADCMPLIDEMLERQKQWGSSVVKGPVSPDGSGFFNGICTGSEKLRFNTPPAAVNLPALAGFAEMTREKSWIISMKDDSRLQSLASAAKERFRMTAANLKRGLFSDPLQKCVYDLSQSGDYARQAERIAPYIDRELSFGVYSGGVCRGYLLTLKGKRPRITTLMTSEGAFRSATACILLSETAREMRKRGLAEAEAGVINEENTPSVLLTGLCESRQTNVFVTYYYNIR